MAGTTRSERGPRVAVVGHVEWLLSCQVDGMPRPGAILHAASQLAEPAGGGGVAAVDLARQAGSCLLFTALGDDAVGQRIPPELSRHGVEVVGPTVIGPHRQAWTLLDPDHERTIVVIGSAQAPDRLDASQLAALDGVYVCKGSAAAVRSARRAKVVVATARMLPVLQEAGVALDALVLSDDDPAEAYVDGDLPRAPALVARTQGARGGELTLATGEVVRWDAAPLPGPAMDAYGCGDCFAAGLTFALAAGLGPVEACAVGARRGALALTRRGAHGGPPQDL